MSTFIEYDDSDVRAALNRLIAAAGDPSPAFKTIGETLLASTKRRFDTETGPDGARWRANADSTLLGYLNKRDSNWNKKGGLSAKGMARLGAKKILQGHSGDLRNELFWEVGQDYMLLGSPMKYAATQHFGASQGQFGRDKRNHPIPWGNIPARPIFGVSAEDKRDILDILNDHYARAIGGG